MGAYLKHETVNLQKMIRNQIIRHKWVSNWAALKQAKKY